VPASKLHPYPLDKKYQKKVAYFSMEFAIAQSLKTYSGGLGYLAGSHMRSAYDLRQNMIGIGILWKYGYYDQVRRSDNGMDVLFQEKHYSFLKETGIMVPIYINKHQVYVKALYLDPQIFGTCPMYFLTTDIPENDYLARTITHKLYDSDTAAKVAQCIVLGMGGAKVAEALDPDIEIFHLNEAHALPLVFHLYDRFKNLEDVKKRVVFTTHTPEKAGNEEHPISLLEKMSFFGHLTFEQARQISGEHGHNFSHSLVALRLAKVANGVSKLHGKVSREMWEDFPGICQIKSITNAQNMRYWADQTMRRALETGDDKMLKDRKLHLKKRLIEQVANQTGKLFDENAIILVWARRFAEYKRATLLMHDIVRFQKLMARTDRKLQVIWAGKPYPGDHGAISVFNHLVEVTRQIPNAAVLTPYELELSRMLKTGSDVWLNTPRRPREASGTSGMSAAMNGSVNLSIQDGWVCEYARHRENAFVLPVTDETQPIEYQDEQDCQNLIDVLENEVLPLYYDKPDAWLSLMKTTMTDVVPYFDSDRMADEYYQLYNDKLK
jgi:starch phosphorylase